ncbi:MAG: GumC family protein [Terrimicrobiaceae bacterium]
MNEPDPLRLSEWPAPGATPPPPPVRPPSGLPLGDLVKDVPEKPAPQKAPNDVLAPPAPGAKPAAAFVPSPTVFHGFDLMRLPVAFWRRWWIPSALGLVGIVLGLLAGLKVFEVSSIVSVRLMARSPQSFAVSTSSYVPSQLQGATLLGALASPQVAREVAGKFEGGRSPGELQSMVSIEEIRKTDFVDIVVSTPFGAEETAALATLWAEEALGFTSRLQSNESAEMKSYLQEQLQRTDRELEEVNKRIVAMREQAGVVDAEKEIDAYLKSLADLDLKYETARIDLEALELQLTSLRKEIRKHSPSFEELKTEEAKLAELAEYYTDQNPVYQEALNRVEALRKRVKDEIDSQQAALSEFTGTYVGNALYLQILELESKRENLTLQQKQMQTMRETARAKLKDLPEMAMVAGPLLESAQTLRTARDALLNRLQEVAVFQEVAPGYYRMFKAPTARDVAVGSRRNKLILAAAGLGLLFFGIGLLAVAGLEYLDPTVRTPAEAEVALQCRSLARIPPPSPRKKSSGIPPQELWAGVIGALSSGRTRAFWAPVATPSAAAFWHALLEGGRSMGIRILIVHLAGDLPAPLAELPRIAPHQLQNPPPGEPVVLLETPAAPSGVQSNDLVEKIRAAATSYQEIWIETSGLAREPVAGILREFPETIVLCALGTSDRKFWNTQRTLFTVHKPLRGVVSIG